MDSETITLEMRVGTESWWPVALEPGQGLSPLFEYRVHFVDKCGGSYFWRIAKDKQDRYTEDILTDKPSLCYWLGYNAFVKPTLILDWDSAAHTQGCRDALGI